MTTTTFIITGFGPFGNVEENPTTVIVRRLDSYLRSRSPSSLSSSSSSLNCSTLTENNDNNDHELANLVHEYIIMQTSTKDVTKTMNRLRDCTIPTLIKENNKQKQKGNNNNNNNIQKVAPVVMKTKTKEESKKENNKNDNVLFYCI